MTKRIFIMADLGPTKAYSYASKPARLNPLPDRLTLRGEYIGEVAGIEIRVSELLKPGQVLFLHPADRSAVR